MIQKNRAGKILAAAVYGIGAAITLILCILFLSHSEAILFPEAMLPSQAWELASGWLALGFVPMLLASLAFYSVCGIRETKHRLRNSLLTFLPAAVCGGFLLFWAGTWCAGMFRTFA